MTRILIAFLAFYQRWISPAIHSVGVGGCRFQPTCSEYAVRAIAMHGPLRGSGLAVWRVLRCHPFSRGGLDQVPPVRNSKLQKVPERDARPIQNDRLEDSCVDLERSSPTLHPTLPEKPLP